MSTVENCTHCGRCREECLFLQKYQADLSDLPDSRIQRECLLCGRCDAVCPQGIRGTEVVLAARQKQPRPRLRQWPGWLEKKHYPFRRYPRRQVDSLLFAGCYFPAFFPRTMQALLTQTARADLAPAFDCCGKPLREMGRAADAERVLARLERQITTLGVKELITLCPNCYAYLQGRLSVPVRTIYQKLREWDFPARELEPGQLFLPCPDREQRLQLQQMADLLPLAQLEPIENVQCCGLGGGAFALAADTVNKLAEAVKQQVDGPLYTYCASCAGRFHRQEIRPVRHLLSTILQVEETPDTAHSLQNRWRFRRKTN